MAFALHHQQHVDQQHDHEQVVPAFAKRPAQAGQFGARQAFQAVACGVGVDLHEQAEVVEQRRDHRGRGDLGVADAEELGDHESRRTHHRRREHRAGGRASLDCRRVGRAKTGSLHHRDRHRAGCQHVRDDGPRHHAQHRAGEDAHLGSAAAEGATQRERQVDEELAGTGHHQRGAEHQKADHRLGKSLQRNAQQALGRQHVVGAGLRRRRLAALERSEPGRVGEHRVQRERQYRQHQTPAAGAPQPLHQQAPHQKSQPDQCLGCAAKLPSQFRGLADVGDEVHRHQRGEDEQQQVVPRHAIDRGALAGRKDDKHEGQRDQDQRVVVLGVERRETDEELERELLVHAQEDRQRGAGDQQPTPGARQRAHAGDLGVLRRVVRVAKRHRDRISHGQAPPLDAARGAPAMP